MNVCASLSEFQIEIPHYEIEYGKRVNAVQNRDVKVALELDTSPRRIEVLTDYPAQELLVRISRDV